jgi:dinuclear metal center YbgI/SA1388 family protein
MTKIKDILNYLEDFAPLSNQEDYDNAGLIVGDRNRDLTGIVICLDSTEEVIQEAIDHRYNLVIAHHPIIFRGLKKITGRTYVERTIIKALKNDISIYALHTNLDNIKEGVNKKICDLLKIRDPKILLPKSGSMMKLVTFIPREKTLQVLDAVHQAGAGSIGDYDHCSFRVLGTGRFRPNEEANPHIGEKNKMEEVIEDRVEVIFPDFRKNEVISSLLRTHPYEEVAYYLHELANESSEIGSGMIGYLDADLEPIEFLKYLKRNMQLDWIKYANTNKPTIKKVAVCGGAGSFLLSRAIMEGADALITADFRYHDFFEGEGNIMIVDIGHYESEQFTKELIYGLLNKKFSNIALRLSDINTNPIRYI